MGCLKDEAEAAPELLAACPFFPADCRWVAMLALTRNTCADEEGVHRPLTQLYYLLIAASLLPKYLCK